MMLFKRAVFILLVLSLSVTVNSASEKPSIKLPEVVIIGEDMTLLKVEKKKSIPKKLSEGIKEEPKEVTIPVSLAETTSQQKAAPVAPSPGCAYSNVVTSSVATVFLTDNAQYKTGLYRFQHARFNESIEAFQKLLTKYPVSQYRGASLYWIGESYNKMNDIPEALKFYQRLIKEYPGDTYADYALYSSGWISLNRKEHDRSLGYFKEVIKRFPNSPVAGSSQFLTGETLFQSGQFREAKEAYQAMSETYPKSRLVPKARFWTAESQNAMKDYEGAEKGYRDFVKSYPEDPLVKYALYGLGWTSISQGRYQPALEFFERLAAMYGKGDFFDSVMFGRLRAYLGLMKIDEAENEYKALKTDFPKSPWSEHAAAEIGWFYFSKRDYQKSIDFYQTLSDKKESDYRPISLFMIGENHYNMKQYQNALSYYNQAGDLSKMKELSEKILFRKGVTHYLLQDYQNAAKYLGELAEKFPRSKDYDNAKFWLAEARFNLKDYDAALKDYQEVLPESARYSDALYNRGFAFYQKGQWKEASEEFEGFISKFPDSRMRPEAMMRMAEALFNRKSYNDAIKAYERLISEYPLYEKKDRAAFQIGWIYYKDEKFQEAINAFSRFMREHPKSDLRYDAQFWLSAAFFRKGDYDRAIIEFKRNLSNYPEGKFKVKALSKLGDSYFNLRRYDEAVKVYRRTLKEYPENKDAKYGIIFSYYHLEEYDLFLKEGQRFIDSFKGTALSINLQYQIGEYYLSRKEWEKAANAYRYIYRHYPSFELADDSLFRTGQVYLFKKDFQKAAVSFKKLVMSYPKSPYLPDARFLSGDSFFEMNDYQRALREYERFMKDYPGSALVPKALYRSGEILSSHLNEEKKGEFFLKRIIKEYPDDPLRFDASLKMGLLAKKNKKADEAIRHFEDAARSKNEATAATGLLNLGDMYTDLGKPEESINHYLKIYYLFPDQKDIAGKALVKAADNYYRSGRLKNALTLYKKGAENLKGEEEQKYIKKRVLEIENKVKDRN